MTAALAFVGDSALAAPLLRLAERALSTLARDREVLVSRGELVAIGGSFKIPEILETSGARLREVGTTNRTTAEDYRKAFSPAVALLLSVHPSNYEIRGYTRRPAPRTGALIPSSRRTPASTRCAAG